MGTFDFQKFLNSFRGPGKDWFLRLAESSGLDWQRGSLWRRYPACFSGLWGASSVQVSCSPGQQGLKIDLRAVVPASSQRLYRALFELLPKCLGSSSFRDYFESRDIALARLAWGRWSVAFVEGELILRLEEREWSEEALASELKAIKQWFELDALEQRLASVGDFLLERLKRSSDIMELAHILLSCALHFSALWPNFATSQAVERKKLILYRIKKAHSLAEQALWESLYRLCYNEDSGIAVWQQPVEFSDEKEPTPVLPVSALCPGSGKDALEGALQLRYILDAKLDWWGPKVDWIAFEQIGRFPELLFALDWMASFEEVRTWVALRVEQFGVSAFSSQRETIGLVVLVLCFSPIEQGELQNPLDEKSALRIERRENLLRFLYRSCELLSRRMDESFCEEHGMVLLFALGELRKKNVEELELLCLRIGEAWKNWFLKRQSHSEEVCLYKILSELLKTLAKSEQREVVDFLESFLQIPEPQQSAMYSHVQHALASIRLTLGAGKTGGLTVLTEQNTEGGLSVAQVDGGLSVLGGSPKK